MYIQAAKTTVQLSERHASYGTPKTPSNITQLCGIKGFKKNSQLGLYHTERHQTLGTFSSPASDGT